MHGMLATGGSSKPAMASIAEVFLLLYFQMVIVLVDCNVHILTYKKQRVAVVAAFLFLLGVYLDYQVLPSSKHFSKSYFTIP